MLQTTVNYLNVLESKRHNLVTEKQTDVDLAIKRGELEVHRGQLAETSRHNQVTESQGWATILETNRHNLVTEGIQAYDAGTRRIQTDINRFEADTHRFAAYSSAGIGWANVAINQGQLEVAQRRINNDFVSAMSNYQNSYSQASSAAANAATREAELSHQIFYDTNMLNINQQNADTNLMNAETNRMNAETNQFNASVNAYNAETNRKKQKIEAGSALSREIREWFKVVPKVSGQ